MLAQQDLDKIINECGIFRYENAIIHGFDKFINSCSESIRKKGNDLNNDDLQNLLYLLKYLYQHWLSSDSKSRLNKQVCLKILFIFLMTEKRISELRQLLEQSVHQIAANWEISPAGYPFLSEEEKDKIVSQLDAISQNANVHAKFLSLKFEKTVPEPDFYFSPERIYDEFIETYNTFCSYYEADKNDAGYLKAIFIAIKEQNITKAFPGILKTLPLHFCTIEASKSLSQVAAPRKSEIVNAFLSGKNTVFSSRKRLFIKGKNSADYKPIPIWAVWFFMAGQKSAMESSTCHNITAGFSLPTRAYAVLFFLLGYETWNAEKIMREKGENKSYFNCLSNCKQNEALLIWDNKRWKRCWFQGVEIREGGKFIKVQVPGAEKRQHIKSVSETSIATLRKAVDPERKVAVNQIGFEMSGIDSLISYYNKKENDILQFLIKDKSSYAVVGNISILKKETEQEKFYSRSNGKYTEMSFQHIIRFKNFMTDFDLSRGIILSSQQSKDSHPAAPYDAVVYDGSLAYLNRQGDIKGNMEIVFLDRTELQFSSACGQLLARYYDREDDVNLVDEIPDFVELIAFKE